MSSKCPPVTVNLDEVVDTVKAKIMSEHPELAAKKVDANVHSVGIRGLGEIRLVEPNVDPSQFVIGFVSIPSVVNMATKLMQVGVIFPKVDLALSRGIFAGVTLAGTLISGGKSFLLGAFLGQVPSTIDALADIAVAAITKAKAGSAAVQGIDLGGLGATQEEELLKLRSDLMQLQGTGGGEMHGVRGGAVAFHY